ncbi:hypothetical protein QBC34DRAFT_465042 [Podospora aff. communis PSN243]|uniref:F-box domain-containing protein n=1 Tax=Podospora aff. communis PSN243 TaxID=3040156 RepID=A0AAV9H3W2_9PEZI|nr:hypothetical protein QBC34DRAFT_465042 [Podospora aff. communis PSN243]
MDKLTDLPPEEATQDAPDAPTPLSRILRPPKKHEITDLPNELLDKIASYLELPDLRRLRDSCNASDYRPCAKCFRKIREHRTLREFVRHIELNVVGPEREYEGHMDVQQPWQGEALDHATQEAFNSLHHLPNLTSACLRFPKFLISEGAQGPEEDGMESWRLPSLTWQSTYFAGFSFPILENFFRTLDRSSSRVRHVCIDNIPNFNVEPFMVSEPVMNVLKRLETLQLYIDTQTPGFGYSTFLVASSFVASGFGHVQIASPLWCYTSQIGLAIFQNWTSKQLYWLSSCSDKLKNLFLDECIVVFFAFFLQIRFDRDNYPVPMDASEPGPTEEYSYRFHEVTWSRILNHVHKYLPDLREFRIGRSDRSLVRQPRPPFGVSFGHEDMKMGLSRGRYRICCHGDYGDDPDDPAYRFWELEHPEKVITLFEETWENKPEEEETDDGAKAYGFLSQFENQDTADHEALRKLLAAIRQRAQT